MPTAPHPPPPVTYQVVEGELTIGDDTDLAVTTGRSDDGVHLVLTSTAAVQLAGLLLRNAGRDEARDVVDVDLWNHVALDLLQTQARARHVAAVGDVVFVEHVGRRFSGYLTPVRRR